jgi:hypothetical protein
MESSPVKQIFNTKSATVCWTFNLVTQFILECSYMFFLPYDIVEYSATRLVFL